MHSASSALLMVCAGGLCKHSGSIRLVRGAPAKFWTLPMLASLCGWYRIVSRSGLLQSDFSFKSVGVGLHPKLQKYLEKDLGS